jgi:hypothetical protein
VILLEYPVLEFIRIGIGCPPMLVGKTLIEETRAVFGLSEDAIVIPLFARTDDLDIMVSLLRSPVEIVMYLFGALIS